MLTTLRGKIEAERERKCKKSEMKSSRQRINSKELLCVIHLSIIYCVRAH